MIDKLIEKFTKHMTIQQEFNEDEFTLTITTEYNGIHIHTEVTDMVPLFDAFARRLGVSDE